MTLFFFITLCLSAIGLITLLGAKRYEMRTKRVIFAGLRPGMHRVMHGIVLFVQYMLPFIARRSIGKVAHTLRAALSNALARLTLYLEVMLHRILEGLHELMRPRRTNSPASTFLQEVAEHKRQLLRNPAQKRAIFEEYH